MSCEIEMKLITGIPDSAKIKIVDLDEDGGLTVRMPKEESDA